MVQEKLIGKISHCYGKIGVGIIELADELKVGDRIHILGTHADFEQMIESMQVNHEDIGSAKAGDSVGIRFEQPIKEGEKVYLVE